MTNKYCIGECNSTGISCLNGVLKQQQYDTTSEWDMVQYNPLGDSGYEEALSYEVVCAYYADCDCIQDSTASTGWSCFADLSTDSTPSNKTVHELDENFVCYEEE